MIELVRVLAGCAGLSEREWRQRVRVAYAKVAEFQARGLVHFHAIVRLDGAEDRATAPGMTVAAEELCDAIREAAGRARLDGDAGDAGDGETTDIRFGEQLHTRVLAGAEDGCELSPGQVAAYVAKYSCKASHEQITTRDTDTDRWRDRGVPEQLVQMAAAALRLAERPALHDLGRWVHMLGFRGHFVTKSRGYSTNLGELRATRAAYRARQDEPPEDGEVNDDDATFVLSVWQYLGSGYLNPGDALLAAGVEASLRPPAKRCSNCVAGHRKRTPSADGLTSGLVVRQSLVPVRFDVAARTVLGFIELGQPLRWRMPASGARFAAFTNSDTQIVASGRPTRSSGSGLESPPIEIRSLADRVEGSLRRQLFRLSQPAGRARVPREERKPTTTRTVVSTGFAGIMWL